MENEKKSKKKIVVTVLLVLVILGLLVTFSIDYYVKDVSKDSILSISEIENQDEYEGILILGAGLVGDKPSPMLKERLDKGIELYKNGVSNVIIMSGDHTRESHDEVNVMKNYAIEQGVDSDDVFMDHAGISTYDSVYRVKELFNLNKVVIVTQGYHLYRALYIARELGVDAVGVDARVKTYSNQLKREIREVLARDKDFIKCFFKPSSTYPINAVEVSLGGNATNDKPYISIKSRDNSVEYFIGNKDVVSKIEGYLNDYEFSSETCDGIPEYIINFSDGRSFGIEVYNSEVHITDVSREIVLNDEDSIYIMKLIKEN